MAGTKNRPRPAASSASAPTRVSPRTWAGTAGFSNWGDMRLGHRPPIMAGDAARRMLSPSRRLGNQWRLSLGQLHNDPGRQKMSRINVAQQHIRDGAAKRLVVVGD